MHEWTFTVTDTTQDWVWYSHVVNYKSSLASAEWIVEAVAYGGVNGPLPLFIPPVQFNDAAVSPTNKPLNLSVAANGVVLSDPKVGKLYPCNVIGVPYNGYIWEFLYIRPTCATHSFNGATSTIIWRSAAGTEVLIWQMNGNLVSQQGDIGAMPAAWSVVGQRDFNGDGKAGILWQNTSGELQIWFMNGLQVSSKATLASKAPTDSTLYGTGDLTGDGKGDLLWRDSKTGAVTAWLMNGSTVTGTANLGSMLTNWAIVASDAQGDIFWRDTAGDLEMWQVQGAKVVKASLGTVAKNWAIAGVGDFNGDGNTDILWRDSSTGTAQIWLMNGTKVLSKTNIGTMSSQWTIAQTGDYDGDGKSDILWTDASGTSDNVQVWFMNGTQVASKASFTIGKGWSVQSANAE
jgi:hypothetical protein